MYVVLVTSERQEQNRAVFLSQGLVKINSKIQVEETKYPPGHSNEMYIKPLSLK